jgi:hypothetical protein
VGTTVKNVIGEGGGKGGVGRKGAAKRCQTDCALKGKRNSIVEPAKKGGEDGVYSAMDVVERQHVKEVVQRGIFPGFD